ncbi:sorting nexin-12 isoform X3 [Antennarius striatus]|uniref:sorting nexin-12 isoform X3 n=1 Tax=Antennarius striatus TaxID=241820 RepID=UPI0035B12B92
MSTEPFKMGASLTETRGELVAWIRASVAGEWYKQTKILHKKTNLPIFKLKDSSVRRRYSDFEWLKNELERDSKIVVPSLPGKALKRQLPFRGDEGIFEGTFIEERRSGLEQFINRIAGHPLAQNERCLHMFLQEEIIDRNYIPGKVRH